MAIMRKIARWTGWALLALAVLLAVFAAFNWRLTSNLIAVAGVGNTELAQFSPAEAVKGCPADNLPTGDGLLDPKAFAAMRDYSDQHGGIGLVVLIDGKLAGEAFGKGYDAATRSLSQSMHKGVLALAIGMAIEDGIIASPDAPVGNYLKEWADDPRGKITFRQLLSMQSGLHNPAISKFKLAAFNIYLGDVSEAALEDEADEAPGRFNYSNINYQIAGTALSRALKAAGKGNYAGYLSQKLWCPLGNRDAQLWLEHEGGEPRYFAFLDATTRDWARVGELIRQRGSFQGQQLVAPAWIDTMVTPSASNPNFGMGIWRGTPWQEERRYSREVSLTAHHSAPYKADDVVFLDGSGGQRVYVVPSAGLVIARTGETSFEWDDAILVNLALDGLAAPTEEPKS